MKQFFYSYIPSIIPPTTWNHTDIIDAGNPADMGTHYPVQGVPAFKLSGPKPEDGYEYGIGDCALMAVIQGVAQYCPEFLKTIVFSLTDGNFIYKYHGIHGPVYYKITPEFAWFQSPNKGCLWTQIIEKGYATALGSYNFINGGWPTNIFWSIGFETGFPIQGWDPITTDKPISADQLSNILDECAAKGYVPVAPTSGGIAGDAPLVASHVYSVKGWHFENGVKMFDLRNPWGTADTSITYEQFAANFHQGDFMVGRLYQGGL